jgi:hypothetical protein
MWWAGREEGATQNNGKSKPGGGRLVETSGAPSRNYVIYWRLIAIWWPVPPAADETQNLLMQF